ncbi:hypothetical protein D3C77_466510 [compost metagenome]
MAREVELERFLVRDDDGALHTVVLYQQFTGRKGKEVEGFKLARTGSGEVVRIDPLDRNLFYLHVGVVTPWISARRV